MLTRKLFRTAWQYKAQFISMIIMVAIGVGIFLGFNMEWYSIELNTLSFFEETKLADFRLYSEAGFSKGDIEALRQADGIDAATRALSVNVGVQDSEQSLNLNVVEDYEVSTLLVTSGAEYDEAGDGLWLSDRFAEANGIAIGDRMFRIVRDEDDWLTITERNRLESEKHYSDTNQLISRYRIDGKPLRDYIGAITIVKYTALLDA